MNMKLLLTSIGKRVELVKHLKTQFTVLGTDITELSAASYFVDGFIKVPPFTADGYLESLLRTVEENKVDCLIPLHEGEFELLSRSADEFSRRGCTLLLSAPDTIATCSDKWETFKFFRENNIKTPLSSLEPRAMEHAFPLFIKPRQGMGSQNAHKLSAREDLHYYSGKIENPIIQKFIKGKEYTIDCLSDLSGRLISAVPRERLEVISGEVSKSRTVKAPEMQELARNICEKLGISGPSTLQCIREDKTGELYFIEINPRFGGGVPTTFAAGINYAELIRNMLQKSDSAPETLMPYKEVTILRYTEAVIV